jgi:hypothetical protein
VLHQLVLCFGEQRNGSSSHHSDAKDKDIAGLLVSEGDFSLIM